MIFDILLHPWKILNFARKIRLARKLYGRPYGELLGRFADLSLNEKFTPREIFLWGLLDMPSKEEIQRRTASKKGHISIQQRLNPTSAAMLTEDKALFYRYCQTYKLAIPRWFGVIAPHISWTPDGRMLRGDTECAAFLESLDEPEIVIKPSLGAYGQGVRLLARDGDSWTDPHGQRLTSSGVIAALRRDLKFDSFVVQQRVRNHGDLVALSDTDFLQGVRIVTALSEGAGARILLSNVRLIGGDATTDNFSYGIKGNLISDIDIPTGRLATAVVGRPESIGLQELTHHPKTGVAFRDFQLPFWQESCDLVRTAALHFRPLITIGWDVAITSNGPVLMEGNSWWDPHVAQKSMAPFSDYVRDVFGGR